MNEVSGHDERSRAGRPPFAFEDDPPRPDRTGARGTVLLVDDIEDCRDVYGQFLRYSGYEVIEAADGDEALAKANAIAPDAIVMDLWMPHLDGWETIRRLKAAPATSHIPILVLTGDAYAQARRDAEEAGCQAYLVKPCLPDHVAAEVNRLVDAARAGVETAPVRVVSERRSPGRRRSETSAGLLQAVLADVERQFDDLARGIRAVEEEVDHLHGPRQASLSRRVD